MADAAVLSVIFTGTVGILGAATAATGHIVTSRNEERKLGEARREDLRVVLDDAAKLAMEIDQTFEEDQNVGHMLTHFGGLRGRLPIQLGRIGVRLGPESSEYEAYERFLTAVGGVERALGELPRDTLMSKPEIEAVARELGLEEGRVVIAALGAAHLESRTALKVFMVAAHARVGADV